MINIFQPSLGQEELNAVQAVFASNWIGKGEHVLRFEREFAASLGVDAAHVTSANSCTEAIFLVTELLSLKPGDEVIAPSISFIAVGNAVVASGASLVLCDVDPRTLNARAEDVAARLSPRTRAVILTHYGGAPCEMDAIVSLCQANGVAVVEDSACAPRSSYRGRAAGTIGDFGVWSFDAMKILCTGDGGMLYAADPGVITDAREQLYLGMPDRQTSGIDSAAGGQSRWWEFEVTRPGRRGIMNNIAGAIGVQQLHKLEGFIARRRAIHEEYERGLGELGWLTPPPPLPRDCESSYYFFWVQCDRRDELAAYLQTRGIYSTFRYWPLHRVPFFGQTADGLANTERAAERTLNLPLHQSLSDDDVARVIEAVRTFGTEHGL